MYDIKSHLAKGSSPMQGRLRRGTGETIASQNCPSCIQLGIFYMSVLIYVSL